MQVVLYSNPVLLADVQADGSGAVNTTVTIPASTTNGEHTLVLFGTNPEQSPYNLQATITVSGSTAPPPNAGGNGDTAATTSGDTLADTGISDAWIAAVVNFVTRPPSDYGLYHRQCTTVGP